MIIVGDCREVMAGMEPECVDALPLSRLPLDRHVAGVAERDDVVDCVGVVGIEMDPTYAEIAEKRIAYWSAQRPTVLQAALPLEGAAD